MNTIEMELGFIKTINKTKSENVIDISTYYFNRRDTHVKTSVISVLLGIESGLISRTRNNLAKQYGWTFEAKHGGFKVVGITGDPSEDFAKEIAKRKARKMPLMQKPTLSKVKANSIGKCMESNRSVLNEVFA
tara:strand:+ start:440 stop:838 length:399 start_codon:yes stop_codon:yes gene_type:complete